MDLTWVGYTSETGQTTAALETNSFDISGSGRPPRGQNYFAAIGDSFDFKFYSRNVPPVATIKD